MESLVAGRFTIEREAGAGSMARVYRARDVTTNGVVALKILNGAGEHTQRRFEREVDALHELTHPGIVRYVAHGATATGQPYLAMEWLDGESLEARLDRGPLTVDQTLELGRAAASALGAAHARGLVHRDVKPANIFLLEGDVARPKLLDFGLTRDTLATFALTNTGDLLGTPLFMAPEQASCELDLDPRCDIYALGAVLYSCIAGRPPIMAPNLVGLLAKIVLEEPPPLSGVPPAVARVIARMLAKPRLDRPATGTEAEAALAAAATSISHGERDVHKTVVPGREQRVVSMLLATRVIALDATLDATLGTGGGALALADGSTMVVFSGPETPVDLAVRAARFALGIRTTSGTVSLATGRAVLSGPTPMGEVIDRAAAQLGAAMGTVRVDPETAALLEGRFDVTTDADGTVLVGERAGELDRARTLLGKPTRCIGRDRELSAIEGYFAESAGESVARAVIVVADAGVGKSRIASEVMHRLSMRSEAPAVIVARCESINANVPFAAVTSALRQAGGISGIAADDPATAEFLGELLGPPTPTPSERMRAARDNPALMFDHIRDAWAAWLRRVCATGPVLLVIEDLHWADEASISLVDAALAALAEEPFMVLALARPEVRSRRPWAARKPHELRLDPLAKRASERLVRDALGERATDEIVAGILARAEGNALFLEELVRAAANPNISALPVGVIGTLQLRFDGLRPEARSVLRVASVYGERFTHAGVAALVAPSVDVAGALADLIAAELVGELGDQFSFRHALVREAAYALMADDDRKLAHALAARVLEVDAVQEPAVIAHHFELGGVFADAGRWYCIAAERALAHNDLAGALAHARLAQSWVTEHAELGQLDLVIAEAELWRSQLAAARDAALRAIPRLPSCSAAWYTAVGLIMTSAGQLGENEVVATWVGRVLDLPAEGEAVEAKVLCLARASSQLSWSDNPIVGRQAFSRADALAQQAELGPTARARLEFARAYHTISIGRVDLCIEAFEGIQSLYERLGARREALQARILRHAMGIWAGQWQDAVPEILACVDVAASIDAQWLVDWARFETSLALLTAGDREAAHVQIQQVPPSVRSAPLWRGIYVLIGSFAALTANDPEWIRSELATVGGIAFATRYRASLDAFEAWLLLKDGDTEGAAARARAALDLMEDSASMKMDAIPIGAAVGLTTLVELGAPDARARVDQHIAMLEAIAESNVAGNIRTTFLQLPWNAAIYALRDRLS